MLAMLALALKNKRMANSTELDPVERIFNLAESVRNEILAGKLGETALNEMIENSDKEISEILDSKEISAKPLKKGAIIRSSNFTNWKQLQSEGTQIQGTFCDADLVNSKIILSEPAHYDNTKQIEKFSVEKLREGHTIWWNVILLDPNDHDAANSTIKRISELKIVS